MSCSVGHVQFLHESRQGLEEIITSFRIHGLDQLWLGSLWFGSRGEIRQGMTASRNTILRCGLDQDMKCCQGLEDKGVKVVRHSYTNKHRARRLRRPPRVSLLLFPLNSWFGSIVAWIIVVWIKE